MSFIKEPRTVLEHMMNAAVVECAALGLKSPLLGGGRLNAHTQQLRAKSSVDEKFRERVMLHIRRARMISFRTLRERLKCKGDYLRVVLDTLVERGELELIPTMGTKATTVLKYRIKSKPDSLKDNADSIEERDAPRRAP
jgi:predicted nucleic acid-binding OB-fold protein